MEKWLSFLVLTMLALSLSLMAGCRQEESSPEHPEHPEAEAVEEQAPKDHPAH